MSIGSFRDVIGEWPSLDDFAADIDVLPLTAKGMHQRDSIASTHWEAVVQAASKRGFAEITYPLLARLKAEKSKARPRSEAQPAAAE